MKKFNIPVIVKFTLALFIVGITSGLIFYFAYKPDLTQELNSFIENISMTHINIILPSVFAVSLVFISSISIIGNLILIFYLFYEGLTIGFTLGAFIGLYSMKGLLFYLIFIVFTKLISIIVLLYFSSMAFNYSIKFIDSITSKNREAMSRAIVYHFYRFLIVLIITFANGFLIYLFGNKIVSLFINLL